MHTDSENVSVPYRSIWTELMSVPFRHDWIDAGGVRTRFLEAGPPDAPALIFVHGTAGSLEAFCRNIAAHATRFRCLALDLIGSGRSDKPDLDYEIPVYVEHVRNFMRALGIAKASFVGVSLGAWITARFALTHPGCVEKITLLSAAGLVANPDTMKQIKSLRSNAVENPSWENVRTVLLNLLFDKAKLIGDLIAVRQSIYRQPGMRQAMAHTLCLQVPEIRSRNLLTQAQWSSIAAPALVVGALEDQADYLNTARFVADVMPNARYVEMPAVGHWPQYEDSETFNRIHLEFLLAAEDQRT